MDNGVKQVHVIFKTHLDVGFTDFARNVKRRYFQSFIPKAIELARQLREEGAAERFIWTTGSWLIYEYLDKAKGRTLRTAERAIEAGDLRWHALPFTTHTELMDAHLLRFGLSLSQEMDRRFGRKTIAAKMTDVPGHTRAIVPLLAEAGVKFLHLGVNAASTPPDVPPLFVWEDAPGVSVVVMYHKQGYGGAMTVPGLASAIAFQHTGDNNGPQSRQDIKAGFDRLRNSFPKAEVAASSMDAFAEDLLAIKARLPVRNCEIGDTWIHGAGTDPRKVAMFREMLRLRQSALLNDRSNDKDERFRDFSRLMLVVPEHTWGLDLKSHLKDFRTYKTAALAKARTRPSFREMEASWAEQRKYLTDAIKALGSHPLAAEIRRSLRQIRPARPGMKGYVPVKAESAFETPHFLMQFDPASGAISKLVHKATKKRWAGVSNLLGVFRYQTFSQADFDRFSRQYNVNMETCAFWAVPDFTKPGMAAADRGHKDWTGQLKALHAAKDSSGHRFLLELAAPKESTSRYGCPRKLLMELSLPDDEPRIDIDFQWFDKSACRLPEAMWLSFSPRGDGPGHWHIDKLGRMISPSEVVRNGNRKLHAVGRGATYSGPNGKRLVIETLDAPLVAPGEPSLTDFNNRQPPMKYGMHFNLCNNIWGTNFPMWYDEDARFRFVLRFG